jgi:hypothetical protein
MKQFLLIRGKVLLLGIFGCHFTSFLRQMGFVNQHKKKRSNTIIFLKGVFLRNSFKKLCQKQINYKHSTYKKQEIPFFGTFGPLVWKLVGLETPK